MTAVDLRHEQENVSSKDTCQSFDGATVELPSVLYDISVLGQGYEEKARQTGIFRVIDSVACQLAQSDQCRVAFCANHHQVAAARYIREHPLLSHIPTYYNQRNGWLLEQYGLTCRAMVTASAWQKAYLRPWRKTLHGALQVVKADEYRLDAKVLEQAQVFHSTAFSFWPEKRGSAKHLQRFQTIYDLIPILFPEWVASGNATENVSRLLSGVKPDDWCLAISQATKDDLCSHVGIDPAHVFVTPLAADGSLFFPCTDLERRAQVRAKYRIPEAPYILSLCTLEPRKNLDHVIRCFARLVREQKVRDVNLVLAGGKGWLFDKIFAELEEGEGAALKERIIVTGYVDNEDLAPLYSDALCFVYPSLYEGFGLPPLEAMQCGVPVITSNNSSLPEVVGDAGIMVDANDEDTLCQSLLEIIQKPEWRRELSHRALARAGQFSWEHCAEQTIAAYRAALAS